MERLRLRLSPGILIWLAAVLLVLPLRWILAWAAAVCVHELGHFAMLRLLRLPVYMLDADSAGARISTGNLAPWQELLCALAGPAAGFLLLLAAPIFPRVAVCGAFQSLYNLLPVYPLDGGRAIRCVAGEGVSTIVQNVCLGGILALGIYATCILRLGLLPLFCCAFTAWRALERKIPCKEWL